jgi:cellulose biosynthesis protein BcsQ
VRQKKLLKKLARKTIAVASGKGGVGKTTTAVNLALYYTKKDLKVGLLDLDPLSDITTLLDLNESEYILKHDQIHHKNESLRNHVLEAFENLDIIFPKAKIKKNQSKMLIEKIYGEFLNELNKNYDILIYDLPAGIRYADNLLFLHYVDNLVLVTNAEPAAHVSAGGYIKSVVEIEPKLAINVWHNKYTAAPDSDFDPVDVVGNYNKNVSPELRLDKSVRKKINNLAFIPHDAALDLLQTNPSAAINIQRCLLDLACFMQEQRLADLSRQLNISHKLFHLVKYYIVHTRKIENIEKFIKELGEYFKKVLVTTFFKSIKPKHSTAVDIEKITAFTAQEQSELKKYLKGLKDDQVLDFIVTLIEYLEKALQLSEEARKPFSTKSNLDIHKAIDKQIGKLLMYLSAVKTSLSPQLVNTAGIYSFYFSLYKLLQSQTILKLIDDFIPKKKNKKGIVIRDRQQQIRNLVQKNEEYKTKYYKLIKTLYPVFNKQITTVVSTFNLWNLMLRDSDNKIKREAYLKLLSHFLHETINSGLSIIIGFNRRPAVAAFKKAADELLRKITRN